MKKAYILLLVTFFFAIPLIAQSAAEKAEPTESADEALKAEPVESADEAPKAESADRAPEAEELQKVSRLPEVVKDGVTGNIVEYGDPKGLARSISSLLSDPAVSKHMGDLGRERVKKYFTWPRVVDDIEKLYQKVLERHST